MSEAARKQTFWHGIDALRTQGRRPRPIEIARLAREADLPTAEAIREMQKFTEFGRCGTDEGFDAVVRFIEVLSAPLSNNRLLEYTALPSLLASSLIGRRNGRVQVVTPLVEFAEALQVLLEGRSVSVSHMVDPHGSYGTIICQPPLGHPGNAHELSREIAAFASSNAGTILLGVADDGALVGLEGIDTPKARDLLCQRIEGLCSGSVRPAITPVIRFAKEENSVVLAIEVPRGSQPVYYSKNTPYVRHLSRSRPAEPHEVIERISEWLASNPLASTTEDTSSQFLSDLAGTLIDILVYGREIEERNVNPWLDLLRAQLGRAGEDLRRMASDDRAQELNIADRLHSIADSLDSAAAHRLVLGGESWLTLVGYVTDATKEAAALKAEFIDTVALSRQSKQQLTELITRSARELSDVARRAEAMTKEGRTEELQNSASQVGRTILVASYYPGIDFVEEELAELRSIGRALHLLETARLYMDGGKSLQRIVDQVHQLNERLQSLVRAKFP